MAGGARQIDAWVETFELLSERGHRQRQFSRLVTDHSLVPRAYASYIVAGGTQHEVYRLRFQAGDATASYPDGTVVHVPFDEATVLIGQNVLPHLAALVEYLVANERPSWQGAYFAPEVLQPVPYRLWRTPTGFRSSLDEQLTVDRDTLQELTIPAVDVRAVRRPFRRPRWTARPSRGAPGRPERPMARPGTQPRGTHYDAVVLTDGFVDDEAGRLGYTIAEPAGKEPSVAMLFIGGSGAHDREGATASYNLGYGDLLERLARRGIASVRYDTRGAGATPLGEEFLQYGFRQRVDDALKMLEVVRRRWVTPSKVVFGHSEGGLIGLSLAARTPLDGLILAATAARPIDEVIKEQIRSAGIRNGVPPEVVAEQVHRFEELVEAAVTVPDSQWTVGRVPDQVYAQRTHARYLRETVPLDPTTLIAEISCSVLVIQGGADLQVPPEDGDRLARSARHAGVDCELVVEPRANHLLRSSSPTPTLADYYDRRRRVVPAVVDAIATWCQRFQERSDGDGALNA